MVKKQQMKTKRERKEGKEKKKGSRRKNRKAKINRCMLKRFLWYIYIYIYQGIASETSGRMFEL